LGKRTGYTEKKEVMIRRKNKNLEIKALFKADNYQTNIPHTIIERKPIINISYIHLYVMVLKETASKMQAFCFSSVTIFNRTTSDRNNLFTVKI